MRRRDFLKRLALGGAVVLAPRLRFTGPGPFRTGLTKYAGNPVLTRGGAGTWDADLIAGQQVFYDTRLAKWVMVYSGLDKPTASGGIIKTGLAYSDDLVTWTKEATNPVLTASVGDVMTVAADIVQVSASSYRLYYQAYPASEFFTLATSSDMLTWADQGHVFGLGTAGQWDDTFIFDPHPVLIGTTTYLWYGGQKSDGTRGIGLATSADGETFTRQGRLITPDSGAGEGSFAFGAPAAIISSATDYSIFHDASLSSDQTRRFICRDSTTDGSNFTHEHQVLVRSQSGWDVGQVFDSAPILHDGTLYLFYAGAPVTGEALGLDCDIGLATMPWP